MSERHFNTTGPVRSHEHYCIDPLRRIDLPEVERLIERGKYFVLHAPRQTGKTSCLLALVAHLNASGRMRCAYANIESAQAARGDYEKGIPLVLDQIAFDAAYFGGETYPRDNAKRVQASEGAGSQLSALLQGWSVADPRPLALLLDEVDALVGDTLVSLLRQLRSGYARRPGSFPQSVVLCGIRDVRDYRIHSDLEGAIITGGSAFNVKAASLRLGDFTEAEVRELLLQHTEETGQVWTDGALAEVWRLTQGQPWLVNALAYEATDEIPRGRDRAQTLDEDLVTEARERLILRRDTHIDQLADKLREERVRRVIGPLLSGEGLDDDVSEDDVLYVTDLGLVRRGPSGIEIANPVYREVIPRHLTAILQARVEPTHQPAWYVLPDGRLDMAKLLGAFQQFFRENSEAWLERFEYREAGPQLLLQAFLQRVVNGGGRVEREYGLGRMRTDLLVLWKTPSGMQRAVIEAKLVRGSREATIRQGMDQTRAYMDRCGTTNGHLLLFDTHGGLTWDERIFREERDGITVWGM
jgi:hypothetical protein